MNSARDLQYSRIDRTCLATAGSTVRSPAGRMPMARQSLPRSALSEPENFIAEPWPRRLVRRYGWVLWWAAAASVLGVGAAFVIESRHQEPVEQRQRTALPKKAPATLAQTKDDLRLPWKPAESRRIVEAEGPIPERVVDLPLSVATPEPPDAGPTAAETGSVAPTGRSSAVADAPDPQDTAKQAEPTARPISSPEATGTPDKAQGVEASAADDTIKKADRYLGRGQLAIARYIYEEAYKAGDVHGAFGMGKSYDAAYLKSIGLRLNGDASKSALWYRRAAEMNGQARVSP